MRKYLIDGNNLIHKDPKLKKTFDLDKIEARESLINLVLNKYLNTKNELTIFFDGFDDKHSFKKITENIFVKYSRNKTADQIIKETIDKEKNKRILMIISSDNNILEYGKLNGCILKSSDEFLSQLHNTKKKENQKINPNLSKAEIEEWLKLFYNRKN